MNPKQAAPLIVALPTLVELAAIAPPLIIGVAIFVGGVYVIDRLLTDDTEKKPEIAPTDAEAEFRRKEAETTAFRQIPAEIPAYSGEEPYVPPLPSVPVAPEIPLPPLPSALPAMEIAPQAALPPPIKKKFVTREDLATVFQRGARTLTRTAAVAALKKLGFGKTAAYAALTPDGRFSALLDFAPDGIITWTDKAYPVG